MIAAAPSPLAEAQRALLDALFARPAGEAGARATDPLAPLLDEHPQTARGLAAYRTNGHALAGRALAAAFPVVAAVLGPESIEMLARALWHHHPPVAGDLTRWGEALPAFVQGDAQLAALPWLADVARVEWALHRAAGDADRPADFASFALLQTHPPEDLHLRLAPGLTLVPSRWPVVSIVTAHTDGAPAIDEAWQRCHAGVRETALVWRQGLRPRVAATEPAAAALLQLTLEGACLTVALDKACEVADLAGSAFDLSAWLTAAVQDGLVTGVGLSVTLVTPSPRT